MRIFLDDNISLYLLYDSTAKIKEEASIKTQKAKTTQTDIDSISIPRVDVGTDINPSGLAIWEAWRYVATYYSCRFQKIADIALITSVW